MIIIKIGSYMYTAEESGININAVVEFLQQARQVNDKYFGTMYTHENMRTVVEEEKVSWSIAKAEHDVVDRQEFEALDKLARDEKKDE